jgi:hypothetical protein
VGEAGNEDWEHEIAALFASRGLDVEIFIVRATQPSTGACESSRGSGER